MSSGDTGDKAENFDDAPLVEVVWLDSMSMIGQTWWDRDEFEKELPRIEAERMRSVGYLIRETEHHLYLAGSLHHDEGITQVGRLSVIPRVAVVERKVL